MPAKCAAAEKEDPALQTSCFCCVPNGPKLSLTERGQIHTRWGQSPGLGYGQADLESFGTAVPNFAWVRGERREPPRGRRHWVPVSGPINRPDAFAKQLPPRSTQLSPSPKPKGRHRSGKSSRQPLLERSLSQLRPPGPAEPSAPLPGISPALLPALARRASVKNKPASKQLTLTKPDRLSSLLPESLLV